MLSVFVLVRYVMWLWCRMLNMLLVNMMGDGSDVCSVMRVLWVISLCLKVVDMMKSGWNG